MGRRTHPTQAHFVRRQWETREEKSSGRRTPVNKGKQEGRWETTGDNGRQGETRPREGGRTIQHRHTCGQTKGDKGGQDPGKVQAHMWGDNGRQDLGKGDTPTQAHVGTWKTRGDKAGRWTHHPPKGNKRGHTGRQDLGKVDTPSNTGTHMWRQGETRPRADTPSQAHMWGKTSGRRAHRDNARQWVTRPRERRTHHRVSMGDTGRHFVFFATVSGEFCYGGQVWCFLRRS